MKWILLALLVACGTEKSASTKQRSPAQVPAPSTPAPEPVPAPQRACAPGAFPQDHVRDEDFLSFPNFGYRGVGRCRGHALLTQKLLLLLRFEPEQPTLWNCESEPELCRQEVRAILDAVDESKAVVVPGFRSLAEFSAHPVVEPILRGRIIAYGSRYSATRLELPGEESRSVLVMREAIRRVRLHQIPYLALKGVEVGSHGVLAYDEAIKEGKPVLCVRDPNIVPAQGREECDNYFIEDEGRVRYVRFARPEDVVGVELTDDEDTRSRNYRRTLCK
jgi:hypothetical protein